MTKHDSDLDSVDLRESQFLEQLVAVLEQNGWNVDRVDASIDWADLLIWRDNLRYVVGLKVSTESRRDRLIALLSQAILQVRAAARASEEPIAPLAVLAAPLISLGAVEGSDGLIGFRDKVAPEVALGFLDQRGFRQFVGPGLETLTAMPKRSARTEKLRVPDSANLFSDLNQWLLKVLLSPLIAEDLIGAPRGRYRNASELANAAGVSMMSASRFVRQIQKENFLDEEGEYLQLVRRQDLMSRWRAAYQRPARELRLKIDPVKSDWNLLDVLRTFNRDSAHRERPEARACLGLLGAANALGCGPFPKIHPTFYLDSLNQPALINMGLSSQGAEYEPHVFVRIPVFRESIFRAAVIRDGLAVADILQVWLEVSSNLAGGEAWANEIHHRALTPVFSESGE